jgi:CheY-like chemotaxis protein
MYRVLLCSERDLRSDLVETLIGRQGIEVYRVKKFADARLVGSSLGVQVILVDRELPDAEGFIQHLRREPATRARSIAVLTRGSSQDSDRKLLAAGANAVFRLPPDEGWDERFLKLLDVPVRQQARMVVHVELENEPEHAAVILNLSSGGMLLASDHPLRVKDELRFRFTLPDKTTVAGRGRVARAVPPTGFGVEFVDVEDEGREAILDFLRSARMG